MAVHFVSTCIIQLCLFAFTHTHTQTTTAVATIVAVFSFHSFSFAFAESVRRIACIKIHFELCSEIMTETMGMRARSYILVWWDAWNCFNVNAIALPIFRCRYFCTRTEAHTNDDEHTSTRACGSRCTVKSKHFLNNVFTILCKQIDLILARY